MQQLQPTHTNSLRPNDFIFHNALSLALSLPHASHVIPTILQSPSRHVINVCQRIPRLALDSPKDMYKPLLSPSKADDTSTSIFNTILDQLISEHILLSDGLDTSQCPQVFHTSPIEVALLHHLDEVDKTSPSLLPLLTQLFQHPSFTPSGAFGMDHGIDCLLIASLHPTLSHELTSCLLQAGCAIGHGILRRRQHALDHLSSLNTAADMDSDTSPCPDKDNDDTGVNNILITVHPSHALISTQPHQFSDENNDNHTINEYTYSQSSYYGSFYAYYPPKFALKKVICVLAAMSMELHQVRYVLSQIDQGLTQPIPLNTQAEALQGYCGSVEDTGILPYIKAFALLLRTVLFYPIIMDIIALPMADTQDDKSSNIVNNTTTPGDSTHSRASALFPLLLPPVRQTHSSMLSHYLAQCNPYAQQDGSTYNPPRQTYDNLNQWNTPLNSAHGAYIILNESMTDNKMKESVHHYYNDCLILQNSVHMHILYPMLGCVDAPSMLGVFHQYQPSTFNPTNASHPCTNESLLDYALQFYRYDSHMTPLASTLLKWHRYDLNIPSKSSTLYPLETLLIPSLSLATSRKLEPPSPSPSPTPSDHEELPHWDPPLSVLDTPAQDLDTRSFPLELFKLFIENGCNPIRCDRKPQNPKYASTLLLLACHNPYIHNISLSSEYPFNYISSDHHYNNSDDRAETKSVHDKEHTTVTAAELVISTLLALQCDPNTPPSASIQTSGTSIVISQLRDSQLLKDIFQMYTSCAPYGVIAPLLRYRTNIADVNSIITIATQISNKNDDEVSVAICQLLSKYSYHYTSVDEFETIAYLLSLYKHKYSHKIIRSILTGSNINLNVEITSSNDYYSNNSLYMGLYESSTMNFIEIAQLLVDFKYDFPLEEVIQTLHIIPHDLLHLIGSHMSSLQWSINVFNSYIDFHTSTSNQLGHTAGLSVEQIVDNIRKHCKIENVYGIDFRSIFKGEEEEKEDILIIRNFYSCHLIRQCTLLALFYHEPLSDNRDMMQILKKQQEALSASLQHKKRKFKPVLTRIISPQNHIKTVESLTQYINDTPYDPTIDYNHPQHMIDIVQWWSDNQDNIAPLMTSQNNLAVAEASAIRYSINNSIYSLITMSFDGLMRYYLNPSSERLRDQLNEPIIQLTSSPDSKSEDGTIVTTDNVAITADGPSPDAPNALQQYDSGSKLPISPNTSLPSSSIMQTAQGTSCHVNLINTSKLPLNEAPGQLGNNITNQFGDKNSLLGAMDAAPTIDMKNPLDATKLKSPLKKLHNPFNKMKSLPDPNNISNSIRGSVNASIPTTGIPNPLGNVNMPNVDLSNPLSGANMPNVDLSNPLGSVNMPNVDLSNPLGNVNMPNLSNPLGGANISNPFSNASNPLPGIKNPMKGFKSPFGKFSSSTLSLNNQEEDTLIKNLSLESFTDDDGFEIIEDPREMEERLKRLEGLKQLHDEQSKANDVKLQQNTRKELITRLFSQQQHHGPDQPKYTYHDMNHILTGVQNRLTFPIQFGMISNQFNMFTKDRDEDGKVFPTPKVVKNPTGMLSSSVTEFSIFIYLFYAIYNRCSNYKFKNFTSDRALSLIQLCSLNPYLTPRALEIIYTLPIFSDNVSTTKLEPLHILCYRHHADRFYDCIEYLISSDKVNNSNIKNEVQIMNTNTKTKVQMDPLLMLSMFQGNGNCIKLIWNKFYRHSTSLDEDYLSRLKEYCLPEYYDVFLHD